ncbi:TolC family protein [Limnobacter litoralis]|uniref:Multidrug transporter n=1 Tax=Limnobacter litoralis TaxID=481366 RepID=A0ABQ5YSA9_9BURK|nr:TolC family protein [Limnobacter litoralis]GLR25684.1 multidrug transporter [Limnobacter litoralis]
MRLKGRVAKSVILFAWVWHGHVCAGVPAPAARDFTLNDALSIAVELNSDITAAKAALQVARAQSLSAQARPNPQLNLQTFNINHQLGVGAGNLSDKTVDSTIQISQLIERGQKRQIRSEAADYLIQAAENDLRSTTRRVKQAVADSYFDLKAASDALTLSRELESLAENNLKLAQLRVKAGDLSGAELQRVQVDTYQAHNDSSAAQDDLNIKRDAFLRLIGMANQPGNLRLAQPWPSKVDSPSGENQQDTPEQPEVEAAKDRLKAASKAVELSKALRTRDITLAVQYEHYPTSPSNMQGSGNSVGVAVQFPLFVWYDYDGEILAAQAVQNQLEEDAQRIRAESSADVNLAQSRVESTAVRLANYHNDIVPAARKSLESVEYAFKQGAAGATELLDARRTYKQTQSGEIAAQADYAKALERLRLFSTMDEKTP